MSIFRKVAAQLYFVAMFQLKAQGTPELEAGAERVRKLEADLKQCLGKLEAFQKAQSERIFSMGRFIMASVAFLPC